MGAGRHEAPGADAAGDTDALGVARVQPWRGGGWGDSKEEIFCKNGRLSFF